MPNCYDTLLMIFGIASGIVIFYNMKKCETDVSDTDDALEVYMDSVEDDPSNMNGISSNLRNEFESMVESQSNTNGLSQPTEEESLPVDSS